jgi:hypothetical protein
MKFSLCGTSDCVQVPVMPSFAVIDRAFVGAAYARDFEIYGAPFCETLVAGMPLTPWSRLSSAATNLLFVVVGDVKLQAEAQARSFKRALPGAFGSEEGVGFAAGDTGGFAMEGDGDGYAPDWFQVPSRDWCAWRRACLRKRCACVRDFKRDAGIGAGEIGGVDVVDRLVKAVELGVELPVGGFAEVQDEVEGGVAGF